MIPPALQWLLIPPALQWLLGTLGEKKLLPKFSHYNAFLLCMFDGFCEITQQRGGKYYLPGFFKRCHLELFCYFSFLRAKEFFQHRIPSVRCRMSLFRIVKISPF